MATKVHVHGDLISATPPFPLWVDCVVLGAGTAESWVVPQGVDWVIIDPSAEVYANAQGTAVVPTTEVTDGTASVRIATPYQVVVGYGQTISFIRSGASSVTVSIACYSAL